MNCQAFNKKSSYNINMSMDIFGNRIKKELKEQGKKQIELARFLNVKKSTLSEWLNNTNEPPLFIIPQIALFLNVTTDYLLGIENEDGSKIEIHNSFNNNSGNINFR